LTQKVSNCIFFFKETVEVGNAAAALLFASRLDAAKESNRMEVETDEGRNLGGRLIFSAIWTTLNKIS